MAEMVLIVSIGFTIILPESVDFWSINLGIIVMVLMTPIITFSNLI
jgi:hypothetical protein